MNRQRNIVFPDTNLNVGRYYRNIASGKTIFTLGQKLSLLLIVGYFFTMTFMCLAAAISDLRNDDSPRNGLPLSFCSYEVLLLFFWTFLAFKALFPAQPARKRRRGYLQSHRR